jgi:hypothetical protein
MKPTLFALLVAALLLPVSVFASGHLMAPTLVKGQFVYTIPADFDPLLVRRAGLDELNEAVKSLHFPYYIVVIRDLPGSGDESTRTHDATDGLAADWTDAGGFDPAVSQIIVLSYNPRKLGLLAGVKFKSELGFERDAHLPYLQIFDRAVKGTPKDPKGGIKSMIKAIDDYLFDQTDPMLIAARAEAARIEEAKRVEAEVFAQKERVMQSARAELSGQIMRLQSLLDSKNDLPADASSYQELLIKAIAVRSKDDRESMVQFAGSMKPTVDVLDAAVSAHKAAHTALEHQTARISAMLEKKESLPKDVSSYGAALSRANDVLGASQTVQMNETALSLKATADKFSAEINEIETVQRNEAIKTGAFWTFLVLLLLGLCASYFFKRVRYIHLQKEWISLRDKWEERIANASSRYVDFYTDREKCARLEKATGKTGVLYASVTATVDEIFSLVQAMGVNLGKYKVLASKASLFNTKPLLDAITQLENTFKFDTGQLNPADLFGSQTKVIEINPDNLMKELKAKYEVTIGGWNKLKEASELLYTTVRDSFSHKKMDELFELIRANGIPDRWVCFHPLYGDDVSDDKVWNELTNLRNNDPIAFVERVKELKDAEQELEGQIQMLVKAVGLAKAGRIEMSPVTDGVVCDPDDDPMITFQTARQEEDRLAGLLASSDEVSEIQGQSAKIVALYKKCVHQTAVIASAKTGADEAFVRMHAARQQATNIVASAKQVVASASKVHSNVSSAEASLRAAADFLAEADRVLEKAVRQQNEKRFLNARTTAEKAVSAFDKVTDAYKQAIRICKDLDQKKHTFESQLARMESNRQAAEQKIAGYGRSSSLTYRAPKFNITSALDYTTLQRQLDEQQAVWDQEARAAQNAYEAEQERQRRQRAEAARRQRELEEAAESARRAERRRREAAEEAAEAARRSSYSHSSYGGSSYGSSGGSSSSSSSSWGSSGSSSSDTSWGSSSDSSSSSSSSSDTSW